MIERPVELQRKIVFIMKFWHDDLTLSIISTWKLKILREITKSRTSYMLHKKWFIRVGTSCSPNFMGRNYHCQRLGLGWSVSCCKHCQIYFLVRRKSLYSYQNFLLIKYVSQLFRLNNKCIKSYFIKYNI